MTHMVSLTSIQRRPQCSDRQDKTDSCPQPIYLLMQTSLDNLPLFYCAGKQLHKPTSCTEITFLDQITFKRVLLEDPIFHLFFFFLQGNLLKKLKSRLFENQQDQNLAIIVSIHITLHCYICQNQAFLNLSRI